MDKSPLLIDIKFDISRKFESFQDQMPDRRVINWSNEKPDDLSGIKYALVWKPDNDLYDRLTDLEVIFSAGAGVDSILQHPKLPDLPIVRFVDHTLTTRMSEWICLQCLAHLRQTRTYDARQKNREWAECAQPEAKDIRVGIMGMGVLGQDAAAKLKMLGFNVAGWSRSIKEIEGIESFDGTELGAFLARTDFLVGLLPLTPETTGIFNRDLFSRLAKDGELGPVFINAGRGKSQNEADIVSSLEDGTLTGASLDVFETEPLQADSPLWAFDNVIITPHAAAVSDIPALASHVAQQIERHETGQGLEHLVEQGRGY